MNSRIDKLLLTGDHARNVSDVSRIYVWYLWSIYKKEKKNTKTQRKRRLEIYLPERTRQGLFLTRYGLWLILTQEQELFLRIINWLMSYTSPSLENLRDDITFI